MGTDSVNINWINDLPPFQSKFVSTAPGPDIRMNVRSVGLKRISRPPSYYSVLNWCQAKSSGVSKVVETGKSNNEDNEDGLGNYKNLENARCYPRTTSGREIRGCPR